MPKQSLEIKDFSGGLNCYSDARDIQDTEFAQFWNVTSSQKGILKVGGSLVQHIYGLPHSNTNFQVGYGLFSTGVDYSLGVIDGGFEIGFEFGTVAAYEETGDASITLATLPSKQSITNHGTDYFYNNYTILIDSGNGAGQTRKITDYTGSSKNAILDSAFDTDPNTSSTYKIFKVTGDGTSFGTNAQVYDILDTGGASSYSNDDIESPNINNPTGTFLRTKKTVGSDNQSVDLGYVTFNPGGITLKAGVEYTLSFKCRAANRYYNYISDTSHGERPPFVQLYSTTNDLYLFQSNGGASFIYGENSDYEFTTDIVAQYIVNGDFETSSVANDGYAHSGTSGNRPHTGWNAYDYTGTIAYTQQGSSQYGGDGISCQLAPDGSFAWNNGADGNIPNCFMYQELTLDDNQWHELFFAYSSANSGISYAIVNAKQGLTASGIYIDGADSAASGSTAIAVQSSSLDGSAATNCTAANLLNRMIFDGDGNFLGVPTAVADTNNFTLGGGLNHSTLDNEQIYYGDFITNWTSLEDTTAIGTWKLMGELENNGNPKPHKFFVPDNSGTPYKVIVLFAPTNASHNVRIDGISVRKSFPDLISMSSEYGTINPYTDNFGGWEDYTLKFKIPTIGGSSELTDASDWVLNLHAGKWGRQDSATGASTSQTVYFDSIRLESNESDNLIFLNDNLATESKIMIYSEDNNNWMQYDSLVWGDNNMMPVYTYINGLLKISDANFNNSNQSRVFYRSDFSKLSSDFKTSGYQVSESPLSAAPSFISAFGQDNMYITSTFDAINYSDTYTYTNSIGNNVINSTYNWLTNSLKTHGRTTYYQNTTYNDNDGSRLFLANGTTEYTFNGNLASLPSIAEPFYIAWAGNDGTTNDMGSISSVGNIAMVDFSFTYDGVFAYKGGGDDGDKWWKQIHPQFEVSIGKTGASLFSGSSISDSNRTLLARGDISATEILNASTTSVFESEGNEFDTVNEAEKFSISNNWTTEGAIFSFSDNRCVQIQKEFNGHLDFDLGKIAATDDMIMRFKINHATNNSGTNLVDCMRFQSEDADDDWDWPRYERILFSKIQVSFYNTNWSAIQDGLVSSQKSSTKANLVFSTPTGSTAVGWEERSFIMAVSSVNIFDEESTLNIKENILGGNTDGTSSITAGTCPTVNVYVGDLVAKDKYRKKLKYYMKDTESNIWYLQFYIDLFENRIYSTTSNYSSFGTRDNTNECYSYVIPNVKMLNYNEVDSYESQTLISQEIGEGSINNLICDYKTAIVANNRLYVGNIKQDGILYPDRMIKSPIGKYNILPKNNFIDVAINDGDEITALEYFKDKILQFKKRKVFVINISGDYEFLEDTLHNVGVQAPYQVCKTPYGIAWANQSGLYIYNGEKVVNVIKDKIPNNSNDALITQNYWRFEDDPSSNNKPLIGYDAITKDIIVKLGLDNNISFSPTVIPDAYVYNLDSNSWYFTHKSTIGISKHTVSTNCSNFATDSKGNLIVYNYADDGTTGIDNDINDILKWKHTEATDSDLFTRIGASGNANQKFIYFTTKDYTFGNIQSRDKVYKVYVTYKSMDSSSTSANSKILVKYRTNGSGSFDQTFSDDSTNYAAATGLTGSTSWTTAVLKPTSSINNIYSLQLQFSFTEAASFPAPKFQINDISIVYRPKRIK